MVKTESRIIISGDRVRVSGGLAKKGKLRETKKGGERNTVRIMKKDKGTSAR